MGESRTGNITVSLLYCCVHQKRDRQRGQSRTTHKKSRSTSKTIRTYNTKVDLNYGRHVKIGIGILRATSQTASEVRKYMALQNSILLRLQQEQPREQPCCSHCSPINSSGCCIAAFRYATHTSISASRSATLFCGRSVPFLARPLARRMPREAGLKHQISKVIAELEYKPTLPLSWWAWWQPQLQVEGRHGKPVIELALDARGQ